MAQPNVTDWGQLLHRKDRYGCHSQPNNPSCRVKSESCSEALGAPDLCFWHFHRMAQAVEVECGCRHNLTMNSDWTGRDLYRRYHNNYELPVLDSGGYLYCCGVCQNTDYYEYVCGDMRVCSKHEHLHSKLTPKKSAESEDVGSDGSDE